jgi:predicted transcriptional regulator
MASPATPKKTRDMVLRLSPELSEQLRAVADVEGRTVSDIAREAITELVEARRRDKRFMGRLEETLARHQRTLDALRRGER